MKDRLEGVSAMKDWLIALIQAVSLFALMLLVVSGLIRIAHSQQNQQSQPKCNVNEFYAIAWTWHNPSERHQQMLRWLLDSGPSCSQDDLTVIWNNLAEWAGSADSAEMRSSLLHLYSKAAKK